MYIFYLKEKKIYIISFINGNKNIINRKGISEVLCNDVIADLKSRLKFIYHSIIISFELVTNINLQNDFCKIYIFMLTLNDIYEQQCKSL